MDKSNADANENEANAAAMTRLSKYEVERQKKALLKRKEAFDQEGGILGRKLEGPAFEATPRVIEFKDYTLNEPHLKTIVLTNVSPSANYFKILPIEDEFRVSKLA